MLNVNVKIEYAEIATYFFEKLSIITEYFPCVQNISGDYNNANWCLWFEESDGMDFKIIGEYNEQENIFETSFIVNYTVQQFRFHPYDGMGGFDQNELRKTMSELHKFYMIQYKKQTSK